MSLLKEELLSKEEPLVLSIKNVPWKNRCIKCGKVPETAFWGNGRVLLHCENCKGDLFIGEIKSNEMILHPAMGRAVDAWNKANPRHNRRRSFT